MEFKERYRGLQVLITKLVIERTRDAGSPDVMNDQKHADCANHDDARKDRDDEPRGILPAATRLRREWRWLKKTTIRRDMFIGLTRITRMFVLKGEEIYVYHGWLGVLPSGELHDREHIGS